MTQYITWIISIISVFVAVYSLFHKENRDKTVSENANDTELKVSIATHNAKLDMLLSSVNKIEANQEQQSKKFEDFATRLVKVEQSVKSAHHRIDEMIDSAT